jgi:hypothetical protein
MKLMLSWLRNLTFFCAVLGSPLGCAGGGDGKDGPPNPDDPDNPDDPGRRGDGPGESWTILVYMVADNDLEPFGLQDLEEMMRVGDAADFRIVVQSDRAADYADGGVGNLPDWQSTKRLLVQDGSLAELDDLGEQNMGNPAVLADFIAWGADAYPADRYALIFWDHGGGWSGFGGDSSTADHDQLGIVEIQQGLQDGMQRAGLEYFDLVGFDACLMATYEVAMALAPAGNYLLASEELEPGHGWDYESFAVLRDDPTGTAVDIGMAILDGFRGQAALEGKGSDITLSLTDLQELDELEAAVTELAAQLAGDLRIAAPHVGRQQVAAQRFGDAPDPGQATNLIDLGDLASHLSQGYQPLQDASARILQGIDAAVVARIAGPLREDATGLSIYFPPQRGYYDERYDDLAEVKDWRGFLQDYYAMGESGTFAPPTFTNPDRLADVEIFDDGIAIYGDLAADGAANLAEATIGYGVIDDVDDIVYLLGDEPASYTSALVDGFWDYTVLTITQDASFSYLYTSLDVTPTGDLSLSIPFFYQAPGALEPDYLQLEYIVAPDGVILQETYYLISDAGPGELTPEPGAIMDPLVVVIDENGELVWGFASEDRFDPTLAFDLAFEEVPVGTNAYVELLISDFAGNEDYVYFEGVL